MCNFSLHWLLSPLFTEYIIVITMNLSSCRFVFLSMPLQCLLCVKFSWFGLNFSGSAIAHFVWINFWVQMCQHLSVGVHTVFAETLSEVLSEKDSMGCNSVWENTTFAVYCMEGFIQHVRLKNTYITPRNPFFKCINLFPTSSAKVVVFNILWQARVDHYYYSHLQNFYLYSS